ncbi:MAG: hypothetical protein FJ267_15050, partial [Planctomycetes bacterium]|nr:hypothetical protein [Planctomycetota bacterium]
MSLTTICGLTLLRTLVLCLLAIPICLAIEGLMRRLSERTRWLIQFFLFVPFCFPELLVGYAYRDIALAHPKWAEPLCALLLWCRMLPVGVIALLLAPRSLCNVESIHCRRLKKGTGPFSGPENGPVPFLNLELVNCYWYGPIRRVLPALGLMALIGLQEFELAALLMTESWTNWFIDAQRLGLQRSEMLIQGLKPFVLQIPLIVALLYWLASSRTGDSDTHWTHDQEAAIPNRSALQ